MRRLGTLLTGTLAALGLAAVPMSVARADVVTSLPITSYYQMAVDSAHGHIFVSSPAQNDILVTNLSGQQVAVIGAQTGVQGLVLSGGTVYAALPGAHAVSAISTTTLKQTAVYSLPSADTPQDVAVQSGKVWVSYSGGSAAAIGDIDLAKSPPAFETQAAMGGWAAVPHLAADPSDSGLLVAADPATSPGPVASYKVSADPATVNTQAKSLTGCTGKIADAAIAPSAKELVLACGGAASQLRYNPTTLAALGSYSSAATPDAVTIAASGMVAAGTQGAGLSIHTQGTTSANSSYALGSGSALAARGLAWSADGTQLFAIVTGSGFSLHVFYPPRPESLLTVTGPPTGPVGQPVSITGTLKLASGTIPSGSMVTVTRTVSGGNSKQFTAPIGSTGSFTVTDTPTAAVGDYTYTASYAGTTSVAPASAITDVQVTKAVPVITLTAPSTANYTKSFTLTGSLTATGVPLPSGSTVTVTRSLVTGGQSKSFTVPVGANGTFTLSDAPPVDGKFAYTASYPGSALIGPVSITRDVNVIGFSTSLTVTTGVLTFTYGQTISITAHLGTTFTNRTVSIYAQTFGSTTRTLLKTGTVNSSGALSTSYPAGYSTAFIAVFAGDTHYAPVTVKHSVVVRVLATEKLSGYYGSTTSHGITYRLYHQSKPLDVAATVAPNHAGECLDLDAQEEVNGQWFGVFDTCYTLNSSSHVAESLSLTMSALGHPYRIRADFVHSSSDIKNINNDSSWQYFMVEK